MKNLLSYKKIISLFAAAAVLLAALGFTSAAAAQSSCGATYTVQRGDYLTKIAMICGVSYSDLLKANPQVTNPSLIFAGLVLNIPTGSTAAGGNPGVYTVQKGDSLSAIARHFNLSLADLREANPAVSSTIYAGQVLNIPARLQFASGATGINLQGQLGASSKHKYLLKAGAGQTLEVTLSAPAGLTLSILGADGSTVKAVDSNLSFRGVLPKTQDYVLVLVSGRSATSYNMSLDIPERIRFAAGGTSATLTGSIPTNLSQFYILQAAKGQTLNVTATPQDKLQLIIYGFDGSVLRSGMGEGASFSGVLPLTQDYLVVIRAASQGQAFTIKISIPAASPTTVSGTPSYTVQKGDTLSKIAVRFQTTVNALLRANPEIGNSNVIRVGQVLYLPGATLKLSNGQVVYIAKSSDTMGSIAQKFNISLGSLENANPQIKNLNLIYPGQRINIP